MSPQSRFMSLVESWVNIAAGIGIQCGANAIFIPILFGVTMQAKPLFWLVVIMTVLSQVRSYTLRRIFEAIRTRRTPPDFAYIIEEFAGERWRQIEAEGFSLWHDDGHTEAQLARAAATYCYMASLTTNERLSVARAITGSYGSTETALVRALWPSTWSMHWLKPTLARRDLIKAGAMIIAEVGRIDRAAARAIGKA